MAPDSRPDDDEDGRRTLDPLAAGISDGVHAGYQAVEHVLEGLRESLGVRARRPRHVPAEPSRKQDTAPDGPQPLRPVGRGVVAGRPARGRGGSSTGEVIDDLARILAELLDRAGDFSQEVAHVISDRAREDDGGEGPAAGTPALLELEAVAGDAASATFTFWNTTPSVLREVQVLATDLFGPSGIIPGERVGFEPRVIEAVRPGAPVEFSVSIETGDAAPGRYRSLAQADPGGACVILQLTVLERA